MLDNKNFGEGNFLREATPLIIDLKGVILMNWHTALQEISQREFYVWKGADVHKEEVKKSILTLFNSVRASLNSDMEQEAFVKLKDTITEKKSKTKDVIEAFYIIDGWLYKKGLTKFDTRQVYQRNRAELSNQHKGM